MPVNGLVFEADIIEFKVAGSASGSHSGDGTGVYTWGGTGVTRYTPNVADLLNGFSIQVGGSSATGDWSVTYTGPGSPLGTTWTDTGWTSAECVIELTDLKLYNIGGTWRLVADYEVFAGGVSRLTGSIDELSGGLGPAYVPLFGVPLQISGSASASTTGLPAYTQTSTYDYQSSTSGTLTGGFRWKEVGGSTWRTMPVTVLSLSVPSVSCTVSKSVSAISATNTYGISIPIYSLNRTKRSFVSTDTGQINVVVSCAADEFTPEFEICNETGPLEVGSGTPDRDVYLVETWTEGQGGSLMALPDLPKAIERFNTDFKLLLFRHEMPQTNVSRIASCVNGMVSDITTDIEEVHPYQNFITQAITSTVSAMEDTLGYSSYAPLTASGSSAYTKTYQYYDNFTGVLCPPTWFSCDTSSCTTTTVTECDVIFTEYDDENISYSASVSFPSSVGNDLAPYLGHNIGLARYINTWPNPHWSYALRTNSWEVDSSPEAWGNYWELVGSQFINESGAGIIENTRNHLVSEPLANDGNSPWHNTFNSGFRWPGISRWATKAVTARTSYTYTSASSSLWSASAGSVSMDDVEVTVTP